jgi:hypothetical protein
MGSVGIREEVARMLEGTTSKALGAFYISDPNTTAAGWPSDIFPINFKSRHIQRGNKNRLSIRVGLVILTAGFETRKQCWVEWFVGEVNREQTSSESGREKSIMDVVIPPLQTRPPT